MTVDVPGGRPAALPTPGPGDPRLARLSLNQWTTRKWSVADAVAGCERAGIASIGLWREKVAQYGLEASARTVRAAGLRVSSLCRAFGFTAPDFDLDDARRAVDEAATLGTDCLVVVAGGIGSGSRDLAGARARLADRIGELEPHARAAGVRLALEPLHPMYCADRAVLSTLKQALDLAERWPVESVGVVVDTFHLWWDPEVFAQIARAGDRIAGYQVCDFLVPLPPDPLLGRGMMGDGVIDFRPLTAAVEAAGYRGDIEVEIFNADVWAADGDQVLATLIRRFVTEVR
ncbi:sugar phosphate isomerase/epimerase [Nocardia panacis]|uniref:Sugar phosphate isomerase/epimerase n=1 Tax=Nocardia panacis TaxID=2340916 RepID=A0A3A4K1U2_9NOCA|nr:sugar phosphate isomerase/epimerase family protein [Nocardia panacis]RJO78398.1 sugar phosphate isomerase/epimerase [Nocardia panacis]